MILHFNVIYYEKNTKRLTFCRTERQTLLNQIFISQFVCTLLQIYTANAMSTNILCLPNSPNVQPKHVNNAYVNKQMVPYSVVV